MYTQPIHKSLDPSPQEPIWGGAGRRELVFPPHESLPRHAALAHSFLPSGKASPMFAHAAEYEVAIVVKGDGRISYENGPVSDFRGGDVLYIPEGRKHEIASTGMEEAEFFFYRVHVAPEVAEKSKAVSQPLRVRLSEMPLEEVHDGAGRRHHVLAAKKDPVCPLLYAVAHTFIDAGNCFDWHLHKNIYELGIVRDGEGTVSFEGGPVFSFKKDDVLYIPAERRHRIDVTGSKAGEFFWIRSFINAPAAG